MRKIVLVFCIINLFCFNSFAVTYEAVGGKLRVTESVSRDRSLTDLKEFAASLTQDVARKQKEITDLTEQIEKINVMISEAEKLGLKEDVYAIFNSTIRKAI